MALSNDLIKQFVKITNDKKEKKKESTVYGTAVIQNGVTYVKLDGSTILTPVTSAANTKDGERVIVMIKDHSATITGNVSSPSARIGDITDQSDAITELEILVADKVTTAELDAANARIDTLVSEDVLIKNRLIASEADIDILQANSLEIRDDLTAANATITHLQTDKLDAAIAVATYATIKDLDVTNETVYNLEATYGEFADLTVDRLTVIDGNINELNTKKLDAETAKVTYANIDFSNISKATMEWFYANSGLIENVVVGDGTITGNLVGVTIKGDLIEGNTIVADKLVIQGEDGLYYKLNTDGTVIEEDQTLYNSLDGSIIIAKSITASKIDVKDLVAFDATIAGLCITDGSIYSSTKNNINSTVRGLYMDSIGQMNVGDSNNFIKYYKDANGNYKLAISADSILLHSKTVEDTIQTALNDLEVGGRNLFQNSKTGAGWVHNDIVTFEPAEADGFTIINFGDVETASYNKVTPIPNVPYSVVRNKTVTISLYVRADDNRMESSYSNSILCSIGIATSATGGRTKYKDYWFKSDDGYYALSTEWEKRSMTLDINDSVFASGTGEITDDSYFTVSFYRYNLSGAQLKALKLEIGDKATDWSPAPEDMATAKDTELAQSTAEKALETATSAETLIQQLSDSISMLVTDGNGTSLMTQTESGWTFSTAEIQSSIASTAESLDALNSELGDTNNTVNVLQQAVNDLGEIAEYVRISTYEDEPCIELGESDSEFKLRITNTRILFLEGSTVIAHITNQSLHIKKAVIEEELQQGGFVWKVRSNGNIGFVWKGVN